MVIIYYLSCLCFRLALIKVLLLIPVIDSTCLYE
jgi:hypothetical protein